MRLVVALTGWAAIALDTSSAAADPVSLVCPHAIAGTALLPPDDRPTTADCHVVAAGVRVPLNTPDVRIDVNAGSSVFAVSLRGHLIAVTDSKGTKTPIGLSRLQSVNNPSGSVALVYDAAARLTKVTAPEGSTTLTYSAGGLLVGVTDYLGALRSLTYDGAGTLVGIVDAGVASTFSYDAAGRLSLASGFAVTRNAAGDITAAAGSSFTYDAAGRLVSVANGSMATAFAYDSGGYLTSSIAGGATWTYTRNALGLALAASDGAHTWTFTYDADQRLTGSTSPTGQITQRTYDARGDLAAIVDPGGGVTQFTRDAHRQLIRVSYPDATAVGATYARPALQAVCPHAFVGAHSLPDDDLATTDDCFIAARGGIRVRLDGGFSIPVPLNPAVATLRLMSTGRFDTALNGRGDRAQIMDGDVLRSMTAPTGVAATLTNTATHLPVAITDALGAVDSYAYDGNGRLTSATDANGSATHFVGSSGRLLSVTDSSNNVVASFAYDSAGRLVSATDGLGAITRLQWSADQHLLSIVDPLGHLTAFVYDGGGRLLSATTQWLATTHYAYDGLGNLTSAVDALGRTRSYVHDVDGHLIRSIDGLGNSVQFTYGADGILISRTDQLTHTTAYTHDAAGDFLSVTDPLGNRTGFVYNGTRSTTAIVDPLGHTTTFEYADVRPPTITVPSAMTVNATSANGALVTFVVTASDPEGAPVSLSCSPASGSTFPIGVTTVACQASDPSGNASTASFTVTVNGAPTQIDDLVSAVKSLGLAKGLTTALLAKLAAAQSALAAGDVFTACSALADFIGQVGAKAGKDMSMAQADALIADATRIRSVIGC